MALHSRHIHNTATAPAAVRSAHAWRGWEISQKVDLAISDDRHDEGPSAHVAVTRILSVLEETNQA